MVLRPGDLGIVVKGLGRSGGARRVDVVASTRAERTIEGAGAAGREIAAASRRARRSWSGDGPVARALVETGANVPGQLVAAFLLWVREQCELLDRRHVVFAARDGELPLRFARRMPADHWAGHRLSYLHVNRRSWSLAAAHRVGVDAWIAAGTGSDHAFLEDKRHRVPLATLVGRLGLTVDEAGAHMGGLLADEPLPPAEVGRWRALLGDATVRSLVADRAATDADRLRRHLAGSGLLDEPIALVDVGWTGQLAWQVSSILLGAGAAEPVHLHIGGANVAAHVADGVDVRRYLFDDTVDPLPYEQVVSSIEAHTASGAAPLVGFDEDDDGRVLPRFGEREPRVDTEQRRLLWAATLSVADELPSRGQLRSRGVSFDDLAANASRSPDGPRASAGGALAVAVRRMMTEVWLDPSPAHAIAAGQPGYEIDDRGDMVGRVAVPYTLGELLPSRPRTSRQWRAGSLRLTPVPLRWFVASGLALADLLRGR